MTHVGVEGRTPAKYIFLAQGPITHQICCLAIPSKGQHAFVAASSNACLQVGEKGVSTVSITWPYMKNIEKRYVWCYSETRNNKVIPPRLFFRPPAGIARFNTLSLCHLLWSTRLKFFKFLEHFIRSVQSSCRPPETPPKRNRSHKLSRRSLRSEHETCLHQ